MKLRQLAPTALLLLALAPRLAGAAELGLTPGNVLGLWTNINSTIPVIAKISGKDQLVAQLAAMRPRRFSGKKPSDVSKQLVKFRTMLNRLRANSGLPPVKARKRDKTGKITPSDVFFNSGRVLDGMVGLIIKKTNADQLVSGYYKLYDFSGKTPSDVYGMLDLANRRLALIVGSSAG